MDEKDRIKDRLLIAYASQLSLVEAREDLPPELLDEFFLIRNALSDAEMPYGSGERAAQKLKAMSEDQSSSLARNIFSMILKLHGLGSEPTASDPAAEA